MSISRFRTTLTSFEQFGLLFLRLGAGIFLSLLHGWGKIKGLYNFLLHGSDWRFITTVESLGFPLPSLFAALAAIIEFAGGLLLAAGLYTRYVAPTIIIVMSVAVYRHIITDMRYELAALHLLIALYFFLRGAGIYSLDRVLRIER